MESRVPKPAAHMFFPWEGRELLNRGVMAPADKLRACPQRKHFTLQLS